PNSDRAAQLLGCAGLRALLNEYQLGRCGLAWEEHVKRRRQFEEAGLLRAFVLCVRCAAASATSSEFVASNADLLLPLLQAMECALSWDFLPKRLPRRLAGLQEAHFTSLASLYSAALQQGLPAAGGPELTGFANVFANLCQHSGGCCSSLDRLPAALASQAAELTVRALEAAASASSASGAADASAGVSEAADSLLDAWAHLFAADSSAGSAADLASAASSTEASAASTVGPIAQTLFAALMRSRLAPPDGFRGLAAMQQRQATEADDDESVHELEETDQVRFASALAAAGEFARRAPAFALSALAEALDQRAELLAGVQQPGASAAAVWSASEDAHWLLLVVGHVIVEPDAEEAAPFVPRSLMSESLAQSANVAESVRALCEACQGQGRAGGGHSQQVDRLLQLVAAVMRMACLLARTAPEPSPLVLTDIAWLLSRLSRVYFGLDETLYDTISPAILAAFGQDSGESLRCCAQFAVDYCRVCLARWPGEPELANEAAKLIIKYCGSSGTRVRRTSKLNFLSSLVASLPSWWQLAQDIGALTPPLTQAPPAALSTAVRAVVQAGRALSTAADQPAKDGRHSDAVERERTYWGVTVGRLQLRAGELISSGLPDSSTEAALALALDALAGCRDAAIAESSLLPLAEAAANLPALAANAARCCWDRWCASLLPASPPPLRLLAYRRLQAVASRLCRIVGQRTPPADASELGQLVGLLHSMLSQSLLDFWSEPEEHLLDGGETASTGAETEAAAVSGFADLLPA
uniref:PI3K/PI4K domain-containing protein n=1 Tax=Macrostomum lignano TaxID=282301 RepID=A0A1I8HX41_9PLAT